MKDLEDWAAVQRVYKQTGSKRATAEMLGIARNTVKRLLEMDVEPVYCRSYYPSKIDQYKDLIIEWRCEGLIGTRIFRELKKIGYTGSIGPVYRFLRRIDEDVGGISSKATERVETPEGDQAQFDWSEYLVPVGGVYTTVYCFSMILAASRKKAVCFSLREDAASIYEAIQELFEDLGGVTLELLIDNPKALVIENDPKTEEEIKYNPYAMLLAKHMGFELNACPYYWPRKKGKVERPFNYIEEQFIKGNAFASMEDLNRRAKEFVDEWCNETHTTTKRIPNLHYLQDEKHMLQPLPKTRYRLKKPVKRTISADSMISINANKYSVPVDYATKKMWYRIVYGFRIEIYANENDAKPVLTIEEAAGKGGAYMNAEHYEAIAKKVSTSIPQIKRDFTARFSNGKRYLDAAKHRFDQPAHYARKIMELQDLYDDRTLDRFIGRAVDQDMMDIKSFKAMLKEHNSRDRPDEADKAGPAPVEELDGLVRDLSYYEELYGGANGSGPA